MIRHPRGQQWLLFTQHDHALLSGRFAERIGNDRFVRPSAKTVQGVALHDCGWPLHDDRPTLNPRGEPLHVFESPVWVSCQVWSASARRAATKEPYAGLLVSIHVTHLATLSAQVHRGQRDAFELNKFQHEQVELQESLRRTLGLRTDIPTNHGLAKPGTESREDQLRRDYHLLRAMDQLSLAVLCSEKVIDGIELEPAASEKAVTLKVEKVGEFEVRMNPWSFDAAELRIGVPCRRLAAANYRDVEAFREAYAAADVGEIEAVVEPVDKGSQGAAAPH